MTTARALLRRLLRQGRIDPRVPSTMPDQPAADQRLEAARQRLKQTIPPPGEEGGDRHPPPGEEGGDRHPPRGEEGTAIPPPEGVSPGEESPPVP